MEIDSVSASNPNAGLVHTHHINQNNINELNAVNAPQQISQPTPLQPSQIEVNSEARISNPGQLINADETLQRAALALVLPNSFNAQTVTSSAPSVATASAKGVPPGNYAVQVSQLAQAQTLNSSAQMSPFSSIGSGAATLNFAFASGISRSIPLSSNDNNLAAISSDINQANIGITAKVLTTSAGSKLQLTGQTGSANAFSVNATGNESLEQLLKTTSGGGLTQTAAAQNAAGSVNGIAFSGSANSVFTDIPGLALNLNAVGSTTLHVAPSTVNINGVQSFINALNQFQAALRQPDEGSHGQEQSLPPLQAALNQILTQSQPALNRIGITQNQNGSLSFNPEAFQAASTSNPAAVAQVFTNNGSGVADRILTLIENSLPQSPPNRFQSTAMEGYQQIQHENERQQEHGQVSGRTSLSKLV